jgi:hypothetical protein
MGYDGELNRDVIKKLPQALKGATRVQDLMGSKEGQSFWAQNGHEFVGVFDLKSGSRSRKQLSAYLKEKGYGITHDAGRTRQ